MYICRYVYMFICLMSTKLVYIRNNVILVENCHNGIKTTVLLKTTEFSSCIIMYDTIRYSVFRLNYRLLYKTYHLLLYYN